MPPFNKVLIANRGEIAVRIIRACRELDIRTVAVFSEIDRDSMHVRLADEAICIGPASAQHSYLNMPAILTAAEITDASAIHPGYGFLSENSQFAETCASSGIIFIGPTPENIRIGGDKAKARQLMKRKGVPVVPGSDGPVTSVEAAQRIARKIGFPVIFKASQGGGGRGMKVVHTEEGLERAFHSAQREALAGFGSNEVYIEKYLSNFRHIEVQILADQRGSVIHLGERDCSIQRRHQKLLEEAKSPFTTQKLSKRLGDLAVKAARALKYRSVGTVEFIVEPSGDAYFMEMNTRIQVEHPVTEEITDIDLIKEQIRIAMGHPLEHRQQDVKFNGHAIEFRINAEDPIKCIPSPGRITFYYPPGGPGVRLDTAVCAGTVIPPNYDSLVAKLIVHGQSRQEAITRARRALDEFIIEGIQTSIPLQRRILEEPDFIHGDYDSSFYEKYLKPQQH